MSNTPRRPIYSRLHAMVQSGEARSLSEAGRILANRRKKSPKQTEPRAIRLPYADN